MNVMGHQRICFWVHNICIIVLFICITANVYAEDFFSVINTLPQQVIDEGDGTTDISLSFGTDLSKQLLFNIDTNVFQFTQSLHVGGTISADEGITAADENIVLHANGTTIFNQKGDPINFRIESDNEENLLFIHGTNDRIGVGTSNPSTRFEVAGSIKGTSLTLTDLLTPGTVIISNGSTLTSTNQGASGTVLVSQGTNPPTWKEPTVSYHWYIDGTLSTGNKQGPVFTFGHAFEVTDISMHVKTAPVLQSIIIDINENSSTIFSTKPKIQANNDTDDEGHIVSDTILAKGSEISLDIDQVGNGTAGTSMTVMIHGIPRY